MLKSIWKFVVDKWLTMLMLVVMFFLAKWGMDEGDLGIVFFSSIAVGMLFENLIAELSDVMKSSVLSRVVKGQDEVIEKQTELIKTMKENLEADDELFKVLIERGYLKPVSSLKDEQKN